LRGYLALAVVVHHFSVWLSYAGGGKVWALPTSPALASLGSSSVALFFMITGFVFYPKIRKPRETSWPALYVTRVFRIVPIIVACVAVVCVIILFRQNWTPRGPFFKPVAYWVSTLEEPPIFGYRDSKFINANVLWSLRCEWIFYALVLPICAIGGLAVKPGRTWLIPAGLLGFSVAGRFFYSGHGFLLFCPLFAAGMIAYEVQVRHGLRAAFASPLACIAGVITLVGSSVIELDPTSLLKQLAVSLFFVTVACGNGLFGILRTKGAQVLGEVSYSIYILHGVILSVSFVEVGFLNRFASLRMVPLGLLVLIPIVTVISIAAFTFIEKPFLEMGKRLAKRITSGRLKLNAAQLEVAP
jgi:peptidoglycan/LPS O-acetylase OafA/YrhL